MSDLPIFWSFRRCPYAMRARMALLNAGVEVELREIKLKDKPEAFLQASASATVPTLETGETVLDESLEIMVWALKQHDPQGLLDMPALGWELITETDGPFKAALDHTKYAVRFPELDAEEERSKAGAFIARLEGYLNAHRFLVADHATLADLAIFPFIRQFANTDRAWFDAQPWPKVQAWLAGFLESADFARMMEKFTPWKEDPNEIRFGKRIP